MHWGVTVYWDTQCTGAQLSTGTPSALGCSCIWNTYTCWETRLHLIRTVLEPVASIEEQAEKRREENKLKQVTHPSPKFCICTVAVLVECTFPSPLQKGRINDPDVPSAIWGVNGLVPGDPLFCLIDKQRLKVDVHHLQICGKLVGMIH